MKTIRADCSIIIDVSDDWEIVNNGTAIKTPCGKTLKPWVTFEVDDERDLTQAELEGLGVVGLDHLYVEDSVWLSGLWGKPPEND
jgi:hypothetical protein